MQHHLLGPSLNVVRVSCRLETTLVFAVLPEYRPAVPVALMGALRKRPVEVADLARAFGCLLKRLTLRDHLGETHAPGWAIIK